MEFRMMEQTELWIGARHVSARTVKRNWLGLASVDASCPAAYTDTYTAEYTAATGPLPACLQVLARQRRGQSLRVIVSDAYCRYQLLPRPAGTRNHAELNAAIRARFQASFGVNPEDWILRSDSAPNASHDFLCALQRSLFDALQQAAIAHASRIVSITPLWIWSVEKSAASKRNCWLLTSEGKVLTAGLFQGGRCLGVRSQRQFHPEENLGQLLLREAALHADGSASGKVVLFGQALTKQQQCAEPFQIEPWPLPAGWETPARAA